ncbi:MAG: AAA family ATPase [Candidatus Edwardsbacteria bacterium]
MPLNKIITKNYKSLKDFPLDLKPFMVFIGPNNAGKSNILDCFKFLAEYTGVEQDARNAIQTRSGFGEIVFNGELGETISFELHGSIRVKDKERDYKYFIELEGDRWGNCFNKRETFSLIENGEKGLLEFPTEKNTGIARDESGKQTGETGAGKAQSYLCYFSDQDNYPILVLCDINSVTFFGSHTALSQGLSPL